MAADLERMNIQADILPIGIDVERYRPPEDKRRLREKYGIEAERRVLLHVGHIRESRNIEWMLEIATALPEIQIILVGSTSTKRDDALSRRLEQARILVFKDYLASIEEVYQLADVYCFPVILADAAMETPLSILEAMATNLPIVTTAFGRLPEQFSEDDYFRYIASPRDIVESLADGFGENCNNREKIKPYTWKATADRLLIGRY